MSDDGGWELYFWEPYVSPHKEDLVRELLANPAVRSVTYVAQAGLEEAQRSLGWEVDFDPAWHTVVCPTSAEVEEIVRSAPGSAIHLFSGLRWVPVISIALAAAIRRGARFGILSEPRTFEGLKGCARLAHSWLTEAAVRREADFVLAIGRHGPPWFRLAGYPPRRIFPFAYFLPAPDMPVRARERSGATRLVFVGRLNGAKGICDLLAALPEIASPVELHVVGDGPDRARVIQAREQSAVPVTWHGVVPMRSVPALLADMDILVLPSTTRNDGWGAVVSEALLSGLAVVATDRVGASICLAPEFGRIVSRRRPDEIAQAVDDLIASDLLDEDHRTRRRAWARGHLTGRAGADHLLAILDYAYRRAPRPDPLFQTAPSLV